MIIDAHMHIWRKVDGRIAGEHRVEPLGHGMIAIGGKPVLGMPPTHADCSARAEWALAEFDAAGVDAGVVVQEYMDGEQNAYALAQAKKHPGRFFVHALADFFKPDAAAREAGRLFGKGFRGLKLAAGHLADKVALDDERFWPLWAGMEADGLVLAVDFSEGEAQVPMMERILARHPRLRVAIGHFGMVNRRGWPGQLRLCRHEHVYMESGGITWLYRHEGPPFPGALDAIRRAADEVGMDKLMWGSDWPRTMVDCTYRQTLDFVRKSDRLTDAEKAMFLGGNAARLYGLEAPAEPRKPAVLVTEE